MLKNSRFFITIIFLILLIVFITNCQKKSKATLLVINTPDFPTTIELTSLYTQFIASFEPGQQETLTMTWPGKQDIVINIKFWVTGNTKIAGAGNVSLGDGDSATFEIVYEVIED